MEEIRIYHSLWKNGLFILICFAFAALGIYSLVVHPEKCGFWFWLGFLFFGLGGCPFMIVCKRQLSENLVKYIC